MIDTTICEVIIVMYNIDTNKCDILSIRSTTHTKKKKKSVGIIELPIKFISHCEPKLINCPIQYYNKFSKMSYQI
jgi:hypothetical protein